MPQIPVVIRERSSEDEATLCSQHGTTMNCPTSPCPGVPMVAPTANSEEGLRLDRAQLRRRIGEAVAEFERVTGLKVKVNVTDNG